MFASVRNPSCSLEAWRILTKGWEVMPVRLAGRIIGAVIRNKDEIHIGVVQRPLGAMRAVARDAIGDTMEKYGRATTCVRLSHPYGVRFCERLGFVQTRTEGGIVHLTCERPRHA